MFYKKLNIDSFEEIQNKIVSYVVDFVIRDVSESEEL